MLNDCPEGISQLHKGIDEARIFIPGVDSCAIQKDKASPESHDVRMWEVTISHSWFPRMLFLVLYSIMFRYLFEIIDLISVAQKY